MFKLHFAETQGKDVDNSLHNIHIKKPLQLRQI